MARQSVRVAMAGIAAAAMMLSACGQPPTTVDPVAIPAPPMAQSAEPAPVEAQPTEASEPVAAQESSPPAEPTESPKPTVAPTKSPKPRAEPTKSPTPTATPSTTKPVQQAGPAIMKQGDQTERVKELQARLKQVGWFSGQVTGNYGAATRTAVAGFQAKRGLPANGAVDQTTWNRLVGMTRKPSADELANKPATTAPAKTSGTNAGDQRKAQGLDSRCMTGRVICISKRSNKLWWVNNGTVLMTMDARFGTSEFRTREGTFSVQWKSRDHVSNIYHTPMPYALFFSGGQAVHFSPDFAARGYNGGSHGCVNLRSKSGAQSLFNQAQVGDKVVVYS